MIGTLTKKMLDTLKLRDHLEEGMGSFSLKNADTQFALLLLTNVHACTKMISQHFKRPDPLSLSLLVHRAPFFAVSLQWTAIFMSTFLLKMMNIW